MTGAASSVMGGFKGEKFLVSGEIFLMKGEFFFVNVEKFLRESTTPPLFCPIALCGLWFYNCPSLSGSSPGVGAKVRQCGSSHV